jgi:hypothetical protein
MIPFTPSGFGSVATFVLIVLAIIVAFLVAIQQAYHTDPVSGRRALRISAFGLGLWLGALSVLVASGRMTSLPLSGLPIFSERFRDQHRHGSLAARPADCSRRALERARRVSGIPVATRAGPAPVGQQRDHPRNNDVDRPELGHHLGHRCARRCSSRQSAPWIAWAANLIGFLLLLNVIRVAILSSPLPFAWNVQPPLLLALHLPYAYIGRSASAAPWPDTSY